MHNYYAVAELKTQLLLVHHFTWYRFLFDQAAQQVLQGKHLQTVADDLVQSIWVLLADKVPDRMTLQKLYWQLINYATPTTPSTVSDAHRFSILRCTFWV